MSTRIAIVQRPARMLDLASSLDIAVESIAQAAEQQAALVVFPETWLTGYPGWVFAHGAWGSPRGRELYAKLLAESAVVDEDLEPIRQAARDHGVSVVIGVNERPARGSGSLFNSLVTISPEGAVANLHRKLVPTHGEKLVWQSGDAAGLRAVELPIGRVGGLVCWEHWNPLARAALHAEYEQIHIAAWPDVTEEHLIASRSYAFEGRCFVVAAGLLVRESDVPEDLRSDYLAALGDELDAAPDGRYFNGGSAVVGPEGEWILEPQYGVEGVLIADLDLERIPGLHMDLDVSGHYSRSELLRLHVDRSRRGAVETSEARA